jgi:3-hydroxy-D-aspartate aldolase
MLLSQLETPALILDLDVFEENIKTMKLLLEPLGLALRPHYKSHKCTVIAHRQIAEGAKGITCAKLEEAEDLVNSGIEDILIANQIIQPSKIARVAYLAGCCHLTICVDNEDNIFALERAASEQGTTIHCLVEFEIGMNRCGVDSFEKFYALADLISKCQHLVFEGIQAYAGQLSHEEEYEQRKTETERIEQRIKELHDFIERKGLQVKEVSGVSTGTVEFRKKGSVYTEIQAGSYIFMDTAYNPLNLPFKNALFVLTTVISTNSNLIVADAGLKSISVDQKMPIFKEFPQFSVDMSEEHSAISVKGHNSSLGDKLMLIPGHCCTTINLHSHLYLVRDGKVEDKIIITSRGKSL